MITIKKIAQEAQVSVATVSLALNNSPLVKDSTKKRIKKIAKRLNYSPNMIARRLVEKRSNTIGLVIPDIESLYYARLVKSMDSALSHKGYKLLLAISNNSRQGEIAAVETLIANRVEGLALAPLNTGSLDTAPLDTLQRAGIPFVFATSVYEGAENPYVMTDIEDGMYRLTMYALHAGKRSLRLVLADECNTSSYVRYRGVKKALDEWGLPGDLLFVSHGEDIDYNRGADEALQMLAASELPDLVMAMNDEVALGLINTLLGKGVSIPGDIWVTGFDDMIYSTVSPVPITTVRQDLGEVAEAVVDMLCRLISGEQGCKSMTLPVQLIERASTGK